MDVTPEYLPRLEALLPILSADRVIWRDDWTFSRQSWQNRARLRNADGWQWITVPVEHGQMGERIRDTRIAYHDGWRKRHVKALQYNYSTTPFYEHYAPDLNELLAARFETLADLNKASLDLIMTWLKREVHWERAEEDAGNPETESRLGDGSQSAEFIHPVYRQNYDGFIPDMSCLDILFNHGPAAVLKLSRSQ